MTSAARHLRTARQPSDVDELLNMAQDGEDLIIVDNETDRPIAVLISADSYNLYCALAEMMASPEETLATLKSFQSHSSSAPVTLGELLGGRKS